MNTYDDYCIVLEDDVTIDPQLIKKLTTIIVFCLVVLNKTVTCYDESRGDSDITKLLFKFANLELVHG